MTELAGVFLVHGQRLAWAAVVFAAFLLAAVLLRYAARCLLARIPAAPQLAPLFADAGFFAMLAVGLAVALSTLGIRIGALLAGLGMGGFVLGFALRDATSNVLAGVLTLLYRPFHIGQNITITGITGTVVEINMRYTVLENGGVRHLIPNQLVFTTAIQINSRPGGPPPSS